MNTKINRGGPAATQAGDDSTADSAIKQLTRSGNEVHEVTDARGRIIRLKRPGAIAKLRFIEALGDSSSNRMWATAVWPLMYVISVDGVSNHTPIAKKEIEALYQRLDDDGMDAVTAGLNEYLGAGDEVDTEAAKK